MRSTYRTLTPCLLIGWLSACGGSGDSSTVAPSASTPVPTLSCAQLANLKIAAASISLPTSGAVMTDTKVVAASGTGSSATGEYCLASGNITPVDPTAPNIQFQVALPTAWNSKAVMLGGGGFDGTIPNVAGNMPNATGATTPLARGYAVFSSDSGHQAAQLPNVAAFMPNQEAYRNWMGDALKKTRDAALTVVIAAYGSAPKKAYFLGGSTGGREALQVAGVWPADWDGVISLYPAQPVTTGILGMLGVTRALAAPGAYPNQAKRRVLHQAALAACDALDGASDNLISNEKRCSAIFNPMTALLDGKPIRCAGGADTSDNCLSDAQLAALSVANSLLPFNFSLASGSTGFLGYNVFTSDTSNQVYGLGTTAPGFPYTAAMAPMASFADSFVRYGVANDTALSYLTVDPSNPGAYASRFSALSALDTRGTDMSGFAAKGGKLLLMHGTSDLLVSPRGTESYFQRLQATLGPNMVDAFARFYLVPGMGHSIGTTFNMAWDSLTALENWVEKSVDPKATQVITDTAGVAGRTRPLCIYPTWAKYNGSGNVDSAASYTCVAN